MPERRRKIWELYDLLSDKELPICEAWLVASVGGAESKLAQLFCLMPHHKDDASIWKALYPHEAYKDNRLRNLFHELGKLLEDFLAFQQFRQTPFLRDLYLIKGLNRRGLAESFRYFFRKVKERWEKQPVRNSRYHRALFELEGEGMHHENKFPPKKKSEYLKEVEPRLEESLILDVLRNDLFTGNQINAKLAHTRSPVLVTLAAQIRTIDQQASSPLVTLYKEVFDFVHDSHTDSQNLIKKVKEIWEGHGSSKPQLSLVGDKSEFLNLAYLILNKLLICHNVNPQQEQGHVAFDFYAWMIQMELLLLDGSLAPIHYGNVVSMGFTLKRWEDVREIIDNFARLLPPSIREELNRFAKGRYAFYQQDYHQALRLLNTKLNFPIDEIISRFYTLQSLYELGNLDDLSYQLDLLKISLLRNNKIKETTKDRYLAKVRYFKRLNNAESMQDFRNLKQEILSKKNAASPNWLIEKCEENIEWLSLHKSK